MIPASFKTNCNACNALRKELLKGGFMSKAQAHFKLCNKCTLRRRGVK